MQGRLLMAGTLEGFGGGIVLADQLAGTKADLVQGKSVVHWAGSVVL